MKMRKLLFLTFTAMVFTLLFTSAGWTDIPAPPANQLIGIVDGIFNNLTEAECRACHDDPNNSCTTSNVDRHHLQYSLPLPQGECSVNSNACLSDTDCVSGICSSTGDPCTVDADCTELGETCGEVCIGETAAPNPYENLECSVSGTACADNTDCPVDETCGVYGCLSCHGVIGTDPIEFGVERDCLQCHIQIPGEASVHHLTAVAQGFDSPLGDDEIGDCTPCHGTLVDDIGDGHMIPPYAPSLVTPSPSGGGGEPDNSYENGAGACDYCHDQDTDPNAYPSIPPIEVYANKDTHHNTGVFMSETGVVNDNTCLWCHNFTGLPEEYNIRVCEGCHGLESLHNIQVDSDGTCSVSTGISCNVDSDCPTGETCDGTIVVGGELAGYGHVGRDNPAVPGDSDCWGCHGFSTASALGSGPVVPAINSSDAIVMTAGTDTSFALTGSAFTNFIGTYEWVSDVLLTAADGSSVTLTPDSITQRSLTVTIPGTTATGNYLLQAVKGVYAASNPVAISIKPEVVIDDVSYNEDIITITGSGFGDAPPEGAEEYINVAVDGIPAEISSWTDTEIIASVSGYGASSYGTFSAEGTVTVNALFCNTIFMGSSCEACSADINNDETVDVFDLTIMKEEFLQTPVSADCNDDGNVDLFDLIILISEYGRDNCCIQ